MNKLWIALLLAGCGSAGSDRICAACEPERLGDTGDLGGAQALCWGYRAPEPVDAARATELGFDVEALESAIARPIDMPMEWRVSSRASAGGGPARGYDPLTSVTVGVRAVGGYRHLRPDPQYCDGTICRFPHSDEPVQQATCARTLEREVEVEVATADGAVRGTLVGTASQVRAGTEEDPLLAGDAILAAWDALVTAAAPLSAIEGSLRLDPQPGAQGYRTELRVNLWHRAVGVKGELSPSVFVETSDATGVHHGPLLGVFPPSGGLGRSQFDAGAPR